MDCIAVRGIRAYGRHGANPGERDAEQPFDIDLVLGLDLRDARRSDDLGDTVDYDALTRDVRRIVAEHSYALLERLGDEIVTALLRDARVRTARVRIGKPNILAGATPSVTVRARRPAS